MKFEFLKPVVIRGEEVKEIEIPLEQLRASDLDQVRDDLMNLNGGFSRQLTMEPVFDMKFCWACASRALKIPYEDLNNLPGPDAMRLFRAVSTFFVLGD